MFVSGVNQVSENAIKSKTKGIESNSSISYTIARNSCSWLQHCPGTRFSNSKVPKTFHARKAIRKAPTHLFSKAYIFSEEESDFGCFIRPTLGSFTASVVFKTLWTACIARLCVLCISLELAHGCHNPHVIWSSACLRGSPPIDKHAPLKIKRIRNDRSPWITNELVGEIHKRGFLKKKATPTNDPLIWKEFKDARNKVNNSI